MKESQNQQKKKVLIMTKKKRENYRIKKKIQNIKNIIMEKSLVTLFY